MKHSETNLRQNTFRIAHCTTSHPGMGEDPALDLRFVSETERDRVVDQSRMVHPRCDGESGRLKRIITPFGFSTTAADVVAGVDLSGKRCIVTGGAAGIGIETARALAASNAAITLAVRRPNDA